MQAFDPRMSTIIQTQGLPEKAEAMFVKIFGEHIPDLLLAAALRNYVALKISAGVGEEDAVIYVAEYYLSLQGRQRKDQNSK